MTPRSTDPTLSSYFYSPLAAINYTDKYARWIPHKGRREYHTETIARYINFMRSKVDMSEEDTNDIYDGLRNFDILTSMRALWSSGPCLDAENVYAFNCAFIPMDCLAAFGEVLYISMCGCGVGFSVERMFTSKLPRVGDPAPDSEAWRYESYHVVQDTTLGWKNAVDAAIVAGFIGKPIEFDYTYVRNAGSALKTKGGRASGPEPLKKLLNFIATEFEKARGRQLRPIEIHSLVCMIGNVVRSGGVRRTALISLSDMDDEEMRSAKDYANKVVPDHFSLANNSWTADEGSFFPTREMFDAEFDVLQYSGSGERGIFTNSLRKIQRRGGLTRPNPCGEINLRFHLSQDPWDFKTGGGSFCNLTSAVLRPWDTKESFKRKIRLATILGTYQASLTHFPNIRESWTQICKEDALLGVNIAGQQDNVALMQDVEYLQELRQYVIDTNKIYAQKFGINAAAALTTGKPDGNSSTIVHSGPGFHSWWSPYYIRRIQMDKNNPVFKLCVDQGIPAIPVPSQSGTESSISDTWLLEIPIKAPEGARFRNSETAIEQLNRYMHVMNNYIGLDGHNQSVTIYVKEHEWSDVREFVWNHLDKISGISFLPYSDFVYKSPPYEEISKEEYEVRAKNFPEIDLSKLSEYESEDMGDGAQELACSAGGCVI